MNEEPEIQLKTLLHKIQQYQIWQREIHLKI